MLERLFDTFRLIINPLMRVMFGMEMVKITMHGAWIGAGVRINQVRMD